MFENPKPDWSTMKKLIWLRGNPATGGTEQVSLDLTAFASPTKKECTKKPKVVSCKVSFTPAQDLHGYSNPWPAGGGVNKLNANYTETFTKSKDFPISLTSGSTVWVYRDSFSYTVEPASGVKRPHAVFLDGSTVVGAIWVNPSGKTSSVTLTGDATILRIFANGYDWSASEDVEVTISGLEISYTEPSSWSPYSNLCPISGWTGAEVKRANTSGGTPTSVASVTFPTIDGSNVIYGGWVDTVTGEGEICWKYVNLGGLTWSTQVTGSVNVVYSSALPSTYIGGNIPSTTGKMLLDTYKYVSASNYSQLSANVDTYGVGVYSFINGGNATDVIYALLPIGDGPSGLGNICYELATPIPFTVSPSSLAMQKGENWAWAEMEAAT